MKHLLSILILLGFMSVASANECSLHIKYGYSAGGPNWTLVDNDDGIIKGKSIIVKTIHPSYGEIKSKAIRIQGNVCYDYSGKTLMNDNIENNSINPIYDIQLNLTTDDDACRAEILNAFQPDEEISIKVEKIYEGHTAHHAW